MASTGPTERIGGYAPIGAYAVVGDGRSVALVARDGAIDWLCWPNLDSPSIFGRLLDANRGGAFELQPSGSYDVERRYVPRTNVLETTFRSAEGSVRVIDALTLPFGELPPMRELVRRVEGLAGRVSMRYRVTPRFGYGVAATRVDVRGSVPTADCGGHAVALRSWGAGPARIEGGAIVGSFDARAGTAATFSLVSAHGEPLVYPGRDEVEARLDGTRAHWERWSRSCYSYDGSWNDAVLRSALGSDGGGGDDVNAGGDRGRAELGLPILLDSRFHVRVVGHAGRGLYRGSRCVRVVVHARDGNYQT